MTIIDLRRVEIFGHQRPPPILTSLGPQFKRESSAHVKGKLKVIIFSKNLVVLLKNSVILWVEYSQKCTERGVNI